MISGIECYEYEIQQDLEYLNSFKGEKMNRFRWFLTCYVLKSCNDKIN